MQTCVQPWLDHPTPTPQPLGDKVLSSTVQTRREKPPLVGAWQMANAIHPLPPPFQYNTLCPVDGKLPAVSLPLNCYAHQKWQAAPCSSRVWSRLLGGNAFLLHSIRQCLPICHPPAPMSQTHVLQRYHRATARVPQPPLGLPSAVVDAATSGASHVCVCTQCWCPGIPGARNIHSLSALLISSSLANSSAVVVVHLGHPDPGAVGFVQVAHQIAEILSVTE